MRKLIWIPIVVVLAVLGGRLLYYGWGSYTPPVRALPEIEIEAAAPATPLEAVDNPTVSKGVVAVDYTHSNALYIEELNVLFSKIVNRGYSFEVVLTASDAEDSDQTENQKLVDKLRYAQALILPLPRVEYTAKEIAEIKNFVAKGGRVLIIGDPTRTVVVEALNSIASPFGVIYANDYLYSQVNNASNYRNVVYSNFNDSPLTKGLSEEAKVVFYGGGSVSAPGHEVVLGDETTHSSVSAGGRAVAAAALTTNDRFLALTDLTFFTEPYNATESNGAFINNIADFLTGVQREFELKDFPFFLNPNVNLVYDNSLVFNSQFDNSVKLKEFLEKSDHNVLFTSQIDEDNDVIYVGRFDQAQPVEEYLAQGGIKILNIDDEDNEAEEVEKTGANGVLRSIDSDTPPDVEDRFVKGRIQIDGVGELELGGATLFYLHQEKGRNILIILSDTPKTNADAFDLLFENRLSECGLNQTIVVCQTQEPDGELPPSLRSKRIDKILVVASDGGRPRDAELTGAPEFIEALTASYTVDEWTLSEKGSPDVDELLEYDAVIWTTGDYWDDSISEEDVALLSRYIEIGGNLILSGASIGFDWDHTDFLTHVAHADYLDFAEQKDIELVSADHPLAEGFTEDTVITFTETPSGTADLEPDVISSTPNARVIFQRGPDSIQEGAASVVAYEDNRAKIAYFAFPIYLLPAEQRDLLVNNTVEWFTRKALPLPNEGDFSPFEPSDEPTPAPTEEPSPDGEEDQEQDENGEDNGDDGGQDDTGDGNGDDSDNGEGDNSGN